MTTIHDSLTKAIAEAREALAKYQDRDARHYLDEAMEGLLAALDAAQGEAVLYCRIDSESGEIAMKNGVYQVAEFFSSEFPAALYLAPQAPPAEQSECKATPCAVPADDEPKGNGENWAEIARHRLELMELVAVMEEKHAMFMAQAQAELQLLRDEVKALRNAVEAMRTAGGRREFQAAFDAAKGLAWHVAVDARRQQARLAAALAANKENGND